MMYLRARNGALRSQFRICAAALPANHSAASTLGLRGALDLEPPAAARFFGLAGAFGAAALVASLRAGRLRRDVGAPPERSARASSSTMASSSVIVSGVLSPGRVAFTPLLDT